MPSPKEALEGPTSQQREAGCVHWSQSETEETHMRRAEAVVFIVATLAKINNSSHVARKLEKLGGADVEFSRLTLL